MSTGIQSLLKALLGAGYDPGMLRSAKAAARAAPRAGGVAIDDILEQAMSVQKHNALSNRLRTAGAMPAEIAEKLDPMFLDAPGQPRKFFHGTPIPGIEVRDLNPDFIGTNTDPGFYGKGVTFTTDPYRIVGYTRPKHKAHPAGSSTMAYLDVRKPFYPKRDPLTGKGPGFYEEMANQGLYDLKKSEPPDMLHFSAIDNQADLTAALKSKGYDAALPDEILPGTYAEAVDRWTNPLNPGYGKGPRIPPGDEVTVFDRPQIYLPYVAPHRKQLPEIPPGILAALFG